jgi:hypothetical protein
MHARVIKNKPQVVVQTQTRKKEQKTKVHRRANVQTETESHRRKQVFKTKGSRIQLLMSRVGGGEKRDRSPQNVEDGWKPNLFADLAHVLHRRVEHLSKQEPVPAPLDYSGGRRRA